LEEIARRRATPARFSVAVFTLPKTSAETDYRFLVYYWII